MWRCLEQRKCVFTFPRWPAPDAAYAIFMQISAQPWRICFVNIRQPRFRVRYWDSIHPATIACCIHDGEDINITKTASWLVVLLH